MMNRLEGLAACASTLVLLAAGGSNLCVVCCFAISPVCRIRHWREDTKVPSRYPAELHPFYRECGIGHIEMEGRDGCLRALLLGSCIICYKVNSTGLSHIWQLKHLNIWLQEPYAISFGDLCRKMLLYYMIYRKELRQMSQMSKQSMDHTDIARREVTMYPFQFTLHNLFLDMFYLYSQ